MTDRKSRGFSMLGTHGPSILLKRGVSDLLDRLPEITEGTEEGFHQARVAIRRIREALAVVRDDYRHEALDHIETRLREAARILGRVRDADVAQRLIQHVEARFPPAAATVATLRSSVASDQLSLRRRAIKKLETLELRELEHQLHEARRGLGWTASRTSWRTVLRTHMAARAGNVRAAMQHAGGVYFPNRVHSARVSIKQLRYTLELAKTTRTWRTPGALRLLKRAQAALGDAHDREMLVGRIAALSGPESPHADATAALQQFLAAEVRTLHAKYLASRSDILAVCQACERQARPGRIAKRSLLLASIAVPSLLLLRKAAERGDDNDDEKVSERRLRVTLA
jgi:CHAD domain-containing protein